MSRHKGEIHAKEDIRVKLAVGFDIKAAAMLGFIDNEWE